METQHPVGHGVVVNPDAKARTDLTSLELEGQQMLVSNRKPFVAAVLAFQAPCSSGR